MGVRLHCFATDANPIQSSRRTPDSSREFDPQTLDGIFNRDSKRIESYPQGV
jgi:hypothetical protein